MIPWIFNILKILNKIAIADKNNIKCIKVEIEYIAKLIKSKKNSKNLKKYFK